MLMTLADDETSRVDRSRSLPTRSQLNRRGRHDRINDQPHDQERTDRLSRETISPGAENASMDGDDTNDDDDVDEDNDNDNDEDEDDDEDDDAVVVDILTSRISQVHPPSAQPNHNTTPTTPEVNTIISSTSALLPSHRPDGDRRRTHAAGINQTTHSSGFVGKTAGRQPITPTQSSNSTPAHLASLTHIGTSPGARTHVDPHSFSTLSKSTFSGQLTNSSSLLTPMSSVHFSDHDRRHPHDVHTSLISPSDRTRSNHTHHPPQSPLGVTEGLTLARAPYAFRPAPYPAPLSPPSPLANENIGPKVPRLVLTGITFEDQVDGEVVEESPDTSRQSPRITDSLGASSTTITDSMSSAFTTPVNSTLPQPNMNRAETQDPALPLSTIVSPMSLTIPSSAPDSPLILPRRDQGEPASAFVSTSRPYNGRLTKPQPQTTTASATPVSTAFLTSSLNAAHMTRPLIQAAPQTRTSLLAPTLTSSLSSTSTHVPLIPPRSPMKGMDVSLPSTSHGQPQTSPIDLRKELSLGPSESRSSQGDEGIGSIIEVEMLDSHSISSLRPPITTYTQTIPPLPPAHGFHDQVDKSSNNTSQVLNRPRLTLDLRGATFEDYGAASDKAFPSTAMSPISQGSVFHSASSASGMEIQLDSTSLSGESNDRQSGNSSALLSYPLSSPSSASLQRNSYSVSRRNDSNSTVERVSGSDSVPGIIRTIRVGNLNPVPQTLLDGRVGSRARDQLNSGDDAEMGNDATNRRLLHRDEETPTGPMARIDQPTSGAVRSLSRLQIRKENRLHHLHSHDLPGDLPPRTATASHAGYLYSTGRTEPFGASFRDEDGDDLSRRSGDIVSMSPMWGHLEDGDASLDRTAPAALNVGHQGHVSMDMSVASHIDDQSSHGVVMAVGDPTRQHQIPQRYDLTCISTSPEPPSSLPPTSTPPRHPVAGLTLDTTGITHEDNPSNNQTPATEHKSTMMKDEKKGSRRHGEKQKNASLHNKGGMRVTVAPSDDYLEMEGELDIETGEIGRLSGSSLSTLPADSLITSSIPPQHATTAPLRPPMLTIEPELSVSGMGSTYRDGSIEPSLSAAPFYNIEGKTKARIGKNGRTKKSTTGELEKLPLNDEISVLYGQADDGEGESRLHKDDSDIEPESHVGGLGEDDEDDDDDAEPENSTIQVESLTFNARSMSTSASASYSSSSATTASPDMPSLPVPTVPLSSSSSHGHGQSPTDDTLSSTIQPVNDVIEMTTTSSRGFSASSASAASTPRASASTAITSSSSTASPKVTDVPSRITSISLALPSPRAALHDSRTSRRPHSRTGSTDDQRLDPSSSLTQLTPLDRTSQQGTDKSPTVLKSLPSMSPIGTAGSEGRGSRSITTGTPLPSGSNSFIGGSWAPNLGPIACSGSLGVAKPKRSRSRPPRRGRLAKIADQQFSVKNDVMSYLGFVITTHGIMSTPPITPAFPTHYRPHSALYDVAIAPSTTSSGPIPPTAPVPPNPRFDAILRKGAVTPSGAVITPDAVTAAAAEADVLHGIIRPDSAHRSLPLQQPYHPLQSLGAPSTMLTPARVTSPSAVLSSPALPGLTAMAVAGDSTKRRMLSDEPSTSTPATRSHALPSSSGEVFSDEKSQYGVDALVPTAYSSSAANALHALLEHASPSSVVSSPVPPRSGGDGGEYKADVPSPLIKPASPLASTSPVMASSGLSLTSMSSSSSSSSTAISAVPRSSGLGTLPEPTHVPHQWTSPLSLSAAVVPASGTTATAPTTSDPKLTVPSSSTRPALIPSSPPQHSSLATTATPLVSDEHEPTSATDNAVDRDRVLWVSERATRSQADDRKSLQLLLTQPEQLTSSLQLLQQQQQQLQQQQQGLVATQTKRNGATTSPLGRQLIASLPSMPHDMSSTPIVSSTAVSPLNEEDVHLLSLDEAGHLEASLGHDVMALSSDGALPTPESAPLEDRSLPSALSESLPPPPSSSVFSSSASSMTMRSPPPPQPCLTTSTSSCLSSAFSHAVPLPQPIPLRERESATFTSPASLTASPSEAAALRALLKSSTNLSDRSVDRSHRDLLASPDGSSSRSSHLSLQLQSDKSPRYSAPSLPPYHMMANSPTTPSGGMESKLSSSQDQPTSTAPISSPRGSVSSASATAGTSSSETPGAVGGQLGASSLTSSKPVSATSLKLPTYMLQQQHSSQGLLPLRRPPSMPGTPGKGGLVSSTLYTDGSVSTVMPSPGPSTSSMKTGPISFPVVTVPGAVTTPTPNADRGTSPALPTTSDDCGARLRTMLCAEDLVEIAPIGRGQHGQVVRAVHLPTLCMLAVKKINVFKSGGRRQLVKELHAYAKLTSPYVRL